jgi:hypothetical protein
MNHWPFVIAAYGLSIAGVVIVSLLAWRTVAAAERDEQGDRD